MTTSRFDFAHRNAKYGYLSTLSTVILGFISRTIFINTLGSAYLGVNALMMNVLGVLSFAELGIGAAMNYSLYQPVANKDIPKIRALVSLYRRIYRVIALIVTIVGLALLPFIPYLARGSEGLGSLRLYFMLFLFSNVMSYFAVYKTTIANAEQRNYLATNIHTAASIVSQLLQIVVLLAWRNYLLFLVIMVLVRVLEQLYLNLYLSRRYATYLEPADRTLDAEELKPIKRNIKSLVWHKIGDISVNQSDSIIIAAFINVTTLGLISNYNLIINTAALLLSVALNAPIGSFGNAIATAQPQDVYRHFKTYRFAAFWIYGVATVGMYALIDPLISAWIGKDMIIDSGVVFLILLNFYLLGQRTTINTVKSAAGIWAEDRYLPLIQAVVNLALSITLVQFIGVVGVFLGTLVQGLLATTVRPIIVYPRVFRTPAREYFIDGLKFAAVLTIAAAPARIGVELWLPTGSWVMFLVGTALVFIWVNLLFLGFFGRRPEASDLYRRLVQQYWRRRPSRG